MDDLTNRRSERSWWLLLLIIPFIALLWVGLYNVASPLLAGFPFFYWYQFIWVIIGAVITAIVYFATR